MTIYPTTDAPQTSLYAAAFEPFAPAPEPPKSKVMLVVGVVFGVLLLVVVVLAVAISGKGSSNATSGTTTGLDPRIVAVITSWNSPANAATRMGACPSPQSCYTIASVGVSAANPTEGLVSFTDDSAYPGVPQWAQPIDQYSQSADGSWRLTWTGIRSTVDDTPWNATVKVADGTVSYTG